MESFTSQDPFSIIDEDGDVLRPGLALLAPGGKQMMVENRGGQPRIRILPGDERLNYKPCVDVTFGSLARSFPGKTLGVILTGMGSDGKEGCRIVQVVPPAQAVENTKVHVVNENLTLQALVPHTARGLSGR